MVMPRQLAWGSLSFPESWGAGGGGRNQQAARQGKSLRWVFPSTPGSWARLPLMRLILGFSVSYMRISFSVRLGGVDDRVGVQAGVPGRP